MAANNRFAVETGSILIMKHFTSVHDIGPLEQALAKAREIKKDKFAYADAGKHLTLLLVFFNASLRTRLSTQKAAENLGMHVMVLNIKKGAWLLETQHGVVMDGDKAEHLLEAIPVMGCYADVIGVRSFAGLTSKEEDYGETVLNQFIRYSGKPVINLESATRHPLQSFADLITIEEYKTIAKPKIVLTWAPHPSALPQAVANSFAEWVLAAGYSLTITHPKNYELHNAFTAGADIVYDQEEALQGAHFVYAKNWSAFQDPFYGKRLHGDPSWTIDERKMALTDNAWFMHCLPVRRNVVVSDKVLDSPRSLVIPQAANREIAAQIVCKSMIDSIKQKSHEVKRI